jgi:outer membrane lipase/esterase
MNCFSKLLFGTLAAVAVLAPPVSSALPFDRIVVFGDSLADSGNAKFLLVGVPPTPTPIPSPAFIASAPYASGRLSNGPVWVEQFADSLGLSAAPSIPPAFLGGGGTNYAVGGANTGPAGSIPFTSFNLLDQLSMFLDDSSGVASPNSLYIIEGGGNDARDVVHGGDPSSLIPAYADNIATILTDLSAAGAHEFLLANVPDASKSPEVQALGPNAIAAASAISMAFNAALSAELPSLEASLGIEVHILDLFGLLDRIVANPAAFNLTDATSTCAFSPQCIADPSQTFFWDGIHPTTAGHALIAQEALAVIQEAPAAIPEPGTLLLMAFGVIGLISFTLARRQGSALPRFAFKPISAAA